MMFHEVCTEMIVYGFDSTDCTVKGLYTQTAYGDSLPEMDEPVRV